MYSLKHPGHDVAREFLTVPRLLTARRSVMDQGPLVTRVNAEGGYLLFSPDLIRTKAENFGVDVGSAWKACENVHQPWYGAQDTQGLDMLMNRYES